MRSHELVMSAGLLLAFGCGPSLHYHTVRDDRVVVSLRGEVQREDLLYQHGHVRFATDREAVFAYFQHKRDSIRPIRSTFFADRYLARLDELERRFRNHLERKGGSYKVRSDQDGLWYALAAILATGTGSLTDGRSQVHTITIQSVTELCAPVMCGYKARRFLLPDGTPFLTVIDMEY